jgi:NTP pyrophosphatase (non-canonical NTP hydrolase)
MLSEKEITPKMPAISFTVTVPGEMAHYAHDIRRFVEAMVYKLEKNADKGKWEGYTVDHAFKLLEAEVSELREEIGGNSIKTILEAADVANFALMIANIAVERGK